MEMLSTLPSDDIRAIMWRYSDRFDLQMLVHSVRAVARGPVAQAVANGARNSHDWTEEKANLLNAFDTSGITSLFMEPEQGGYIAGPKNLALAIAAFELSWVDGGSATGSLAGNLALEPIHERGTPEQKQYYMCGAVPPQPGENRKILRGAFGLTEPLPFVGVETGLLGGKVRVAAWNEGEEPLLQVDKRGRFITNMDFANFVCAAVESDDDRIKGTCMIIVEEDDPGLFDRGAPTLKLVHQLSSTRDPIISQQVPAHRIIGGYTIQDGIIVPNYNHSEIIEAVFKRTRVTVGLMTAAKLLSAVEPIIRYQRGRFRGGNLEPGSPRYELGIQQKDDALHRTVTIWAMGEAAASFGFEGARLFDELAPLEDEKFKIFNEQGIRGGRAEFKALKAKEKKAIEYIQLKAKDQTQTARYAELESDPLVKYVAIDSLANVLCPAIKLWNTGQGATIMREAVSLMGGYGITEDCPGFLGQKWMDAQLEATYEGPEAVQRRQLTITLITPVFQACFQTWIDTLKSIAQSRPETGAEALATAMELWRYTLNYLQTRKDTHGVKLWGSARQGVTFPMADAFSWLAASYHQILDVVELALNGPNNPAVVEGLDSTIAFFSDLCMIQVARAVGEAGRVCTELFYGYEVDGHDDTEFIEFKTKADRLTAGAGHARDRAGVALTRVMIPEALDYPQ
ncbi:acyl-CoA dehydrogenase [candidate division KSB1 bacterium]|nr:acyl-CoA/acyl-ACP dehydrogenase [candidate division KSB1 bacterium]RQW01462.1 MAG: acyl-CoA dehydrogenase [candidate division KSB1 bacterium]